MSIKKSLIFGHVGITLTAGLVLKKAFSHKSAHVEPNETDVGTSLNRTSTLRKVVGKMDLRILIAGSMLPDLIDKPLGQVIFKESIGNGRIYAHTLLFLIVISAIGYHLYRARQHVWLVALSFGSLLHIIEDELWLMQKTLFWPFMSVTFDKLDLDYWIGGMWYEFLHDPGVYIPEWIGIAVVVGFAAWLFYRKEVQRF
ncbi:metal-dependent hydrolase [Chloroflexota bacterium]